MKQICLYLSLLVYQASAHVVPNKTDIPEPHLKRSTREVRGHIPDDPAFMAVVIHEGCEKLCGGVFLTPKSILTLANCVKKGKTKIKIYPNIPNYLPHCEEDLNVFPIDRVHFVPGYNPKSHQKDTTSLAIVYLEKPVSKVQTPSINYVFNMRAKDPTILYSLGIHKPVQITTIDDPDKCKVTKPKDASVVCGSLAAAETHKCYLVPGLPIIVHEKGQIYLKGLLIDPIGCPARTLLYVNVTSHSKWILSEIEHANGISPHVIANDSLTMRSHKFIHEPINPDIVVHKTWPWPVENHHIDNSMTSVHSNHVSQGCVCNCEQRKANHSDPLEEEIFGATERSNNNNNNNNDVKGNVVNSNQNNNENQNQ
ncbi:uncharacterized protein LOC107369408 [Tetranychus urticae]|uniref:Peptidase S1 domain-containing protein n=1 Tax=Tetranychus urticae TaxID=32264 RepID=T1L234_TETUR|nr:uncharacterized protein LOC107369408 [Tetranychus urticae]